MKPLAPILRLLAPRDGSADGSRLPRLKVGDRLQGRVVRTGGDGAIELALAGRRWRASSAVALRPGDRIEVVIDRHQDTLVLRLTSSWRPIPESVLEHSERRAQAMELPRLYRRLAARPELVAQRPSLRFGAPTRTLGRQLRAAVESSGLFLESRLRAGGDVQHDLRALLARRPADDVLARELSAALEALQELDAESLERSGPLFLPLPAELDGEPIEIGLRGRRSERDGGRHRLDVEVDFRGTGPVRIELESDGDVVHGRLRFRDPDVLAEVLDELDTLAGRAGLEELNADLWEEDDDPLVPPTPEVGPEGSSQWLDARA